MIRQNHRRGIAIMVLLIAAKTASKVQRDIPAAQLVDLNFIQEAQPQLELS